MKLSINTITQLVTQLALISQVAGKVWFEEHFNYAEGKDEFLKKWHVPKHGPKDQEGKTIELGKWDIFSGLFNADKHINKGLHTTQDLHFYALYSKLPQPINNKDKTLILQFSVKHEQLIDCGGGYLKLLPSDAVVDELNGETPYYLMFGPDICGPHRIIHAIIHYKGTNYLLNKKVNAPADTETHLYRFLLRPDQTYQILLDNNEVAAGSLVDDWDCLGPKTIPDPKASKPHDWIDEAEIVDPEDFKPEDWDSEPEKIIDPHATKPADWDDDMDGEWSAPMIVNPAFKGQWKAKKIPNPAYTGPWEHPHIPNPDFKLDHNIYLMPKIGYIAFDLWQVKSGTIFDNILLTDDVDYADKLAETTWASLQEEEKKAKEAYEKELMAKPLDEQIKENAARAGKLDPIELENFVEAEKSEL